MGTDLGGDHDIVAVAPGRVPVADDRLALAPGVARHPVRVAVCRVDEVASAGNKPVEHVERGRLIGRPPENIAAENERENLQVRICNPAARGSGCVRENSF